jgi:beta-N-acetylhexosaminidase
MAPSAVIFGIDGQAITPWERDFLRDADPWGFILFARNIDDPAQLRALTTDLRAVVGRDAPILIDQEGGRVQRMRAPHWRDYLPALDQMERVRARGGDPIRAQWLRNRLIAVELHDVGIDVNCAPLADLVEEGTHPILLNRLYGTDIDTVVRAARACADGLLAGGVLPVLKHIPGYGRAQVDSHLSLPRVDHPLDQIRARDFAPFAALNDIAMGMTAHIVFSALDPDRPATTSAKVMSMIREEIGFDGLVMSDDIGMEALSGTLAERAQATLNAGVDIVLQCSGVPDDMAAVADVVPPLTDIARSRAEAALAARQSPAPADIAGLQAELRSLLGAP